jgi:hypothetical protein
MYDKNKKRRIALQILKSKKTHSGVTSPSLGDCTAREELASMNGLRSMKLAAANAFLCSPAVVPENSLDDTKQRCQFVGTPSAKCCSKSKFSPRGNSGLISNSRGTVEKSLVVLLQATSKTNSLSCVPNSTGWLSSTRCKCN